MNHLNFLTGRVVPNSINVDFEIRAIKRVWLPFSPIEANGLAALYLNDQVFRNNIRMICALAFVPIPDNQRSFNALCQICGNVPIIVYFATNYVGELRNGIRRPPIFEHELWSVYDRVGGK